MALLALGINHKTAPVEVREKVAFAPDSLTAALQDACLQAGLREAAILSTCNRTEVYCSMDQFDADPLLDWIGRFHGVPTRELSEFSYLHWDEHAARHMMKVASGLDSLVLGEPQILGQLKSAYASAREAQTVSAELGRLFEQTFSVAKRVRTDTAIGENPVSVAYAAVNLAGHIFSDLSRSRALLIGAGKTVELVARHLKEAGVRDMTVANRTLARAEDLAGKIGGDAVLLSDIPDRLPYADIVIASTASQLPVLGKGAVERALKLRKHQPIFMCDIAVPRDIEPQVADLDDVYLYTVDDLRQVIEDNIRSREGAAREAEHLVESGAAEFMLQLRAMSATSVLKAFRSDAEQLRDIEVDKALRAIRNGGDPEAVISSLGRTLTNKLIHQPSVQVRKASSEGRIEVIDWLCELHDVRTPSSESASADDTGQNDSEPK